MSASRGMTTIITELATAIWSILPRWGRWTITGAWSAGDMAGMDLFDSGAAWWGVGDCYVGIRSPN